MAFGRISSLPGSANRPISSYVDIAGATTLIAVVGDELGAVEGVADPREINTGTGFDTAVSDPGNAVPSNSETIAYDCITLS